MSECAWCNICDGSEVKVASRPNCSIRIIEMPSAPENG